MELRARQWLKVIHPKKVADSANSHFVDLARSLLRWFGVGGARQQESGPRHSCTGCSTHPDEVASRDPLSRHKLKELFHNDPHRRKAAAKWFRNRGNEEVGAALAGALEIEENIAVRRELVGSLRSRAARCAPRQGER